MAASTLTVKMVKMTKTQELAAENQTNPRTTIPTTTPMAIPNTAPHLQPLPKSVEYSNHKKVAKKDSLADLLLLKRRTTKQLTKEHLSPDSPRRIR